MKTTDINNFFTRLDLLLRKKARVILTGGAASLLLGGSRPTQDIDFYLASQEGPYLEQSIATVEKETDTAAQYSADIDRWSSISYLDYKKHTQPYKTFGKITVEILAPEYWSIGKMARFYESDINDMVVVFKKNKIQLQNLIPLWAKALKKSPRSVASHQFKRQVEFFIKTYGPEIWGDKFNETRSLKLWANNLGVSKDV